MTEFVNNVSNTGGGVDEINRLVAAFRNPGAVRTNLKTCTCQSSWWGQHLRDRFCFVSAFECTVCAPVNSIIACQSTHEDACGFYFVACERKYASEWTFHFLLA